MPRKHYYQTKKSRQLKKLHSDNDVNTMNNSELVVEKVEDDRLSNIELELRDISPSTSASPTAIERYINEKNKELMECFRAEIHSMKRSILYDIEKKALEIKNTILFNNTGSGLQQPNLTHAKAELNVGLPIGNLDDFNTFDESLGDEKKRKALMMLYRMILAGESTAKACISKSMLATVTKDVEIHFSGTGRKVKGIGKLDFSGTRVFKCLQDIIIEKFGDTAEAQNLPGKIGRWLSGATDRDGGRKQR